MARFGERRAMQARISVGVVRAEEVPSQVSMSAPFWPGPPSWCRPSPHCTSIRPSASTGCVVSTPKVSVVPDTL